MLEAKGIGASASLRQNHSSEDSEITEALTEPSDLPTGIKLVVLVWCACMAIFALALVGSMLPL